MRMAKRSTIHIQLKTAPTVVLVMDLATVHELIVSAMDLELEQLTFIKEYNK